jgi:hypothetical protein
LGKAKSVPKAKNRTFSQVFAEATAGVAERATPPRIRFGDRRDRFDDAPITRRA